MKVSSYAKEYAAPAIYLVAILGLIVIVICRDVPKVGHDYGFFIPRMLDTYLHQKVNGLVIQWYTANFGAGTPAYPNPQYLQYSLPQFSMLLINPWWALMLSLVTYSAIGFIGFYLFLREEIGWISLACALAASFILANGFFVEHAIVGHVGFQHFPLLGAILFLAFSKRLGILTAGILIGLLVAMILNQAGFIILILFVLSTIMLLPLIYLMRPELFTKKLFATLLAAGFFSLLLSLSKVSAVLAFMRFFPRVIGDQYNQTYWQGIIGMLRQLIGFNFMVPYFLLTGRHMQVVSDFFHQGAGAEFGLWEMDTFLSPALLLLLLIGLGYLIFAITRRKPNISGKKVIALLFLCLGIWLAADLSLAQGWLYTLLKPLPVLRSLHANVRFTAAFIFPFALLGGLIFHKVFQQKIWSGRVAFLVLGISTLAMLSLFQTLPDTAQLRSFNLNSALPVYAELDKGWNFTLQNVANITDMEVFRQEDSNLASQDPMFGYQGEYFKPKAGVGSILKVSNGTYNMTNPASYVFPKENHLQPFDLFRVDQKQNLELFINHKQPHLAISSWQTFADMVSLAALILSVLFLLFIVVRESIRFLQGLAHRSYKQEERVI